MQGSAAVVMALCMTSVASFPLPPMSRRHAHVACRRRGSAATEGILRLRASAETSYVSVTSTSNSFAKRMVRLRDQAKFRREESCAVVVGSAPILELCAQGGGAEGCLQALMLLEEEGRDMWHADFLASLDTSPPLIYVASTAVFQKVAGLESAEGRQAAAEIRLPQMQTVAEMLRPTVHRTADSSSVRDLAPILVLDRVQDPGNVGTLLRTAAGLGWSCLLLDGCCDIYNDKVIRAARGAAWRAPLAVTSFAALMEELSRTDQRPCVFVADMGGCDPLKAKMKSDMESPLLLILSNEGAGVSAAVKSALSTHSDSWATVGVPLKGDMESLNVAVAGSILMYALRPP